MLVCVYECARARVCVYVTDYVLPLLYNHKSLTYAETHTLTRTYIYIRTRVCNNMTKAIRRVHLGDQASMA